MARLILIFGFLAIEVLLGICLYKNAKANSEYKKALTRVMAVCACTVALYLAFCTMMQSSMVGSLLQGLYLSSLDWLILMVLDFTRQYIDKDYPFKSAKMILVALAVGDTFSMTINPLTNHAFTITEQQVFGETYWQVQPLLGEYLHYLFCYLVVMDILVMLIHKAIQVPTMYKSRYIVLPSFIVVILVLNALCLFHATPIDYSVYMYGATACFLCYYAVFKLPVQLVHSIQKIITDEMNSALFCFDLEGRCIYTNAYARNIFGLNDSMLHQAEEQLKKKLANHSEEDSFENWGETIHIGGKTYRFSLDHSWLKDKKGRKLGLFFEMKDRTEEVERYEKERFRATHDPLTGLYNREGFYEAAREEINRDPSIRRMIVYSNIREFKLINDLFGKEKGDAVLIKEAELMKKFSQFGTVNGRMGADQFAMLVQKSRYSEAVYMQCIEDMCQLIEGSVYKMHVSVGVYEITDPNEDLSLMCDKAGIVIDQIKNDYNRHIAYYSDLTMSKIIDDRILIAEFEDAIREEQFVIYLQPQISSKDESVLGAEALVRWQHPKRGLMFPGQFIDIFEKSGLIHRMDKAVWEQAAKQLSIWKKRGIDLHISVNISAVDFYYLDIVSIMKGLVEKYDIEPWRLNLEITETVLMKDVLMHMAVLAQLRDYGFHIEIDDFGSGYSSLNTLKDLDADVLKIDMLFLQETKNKIKSRLILESVVGMAKKLEMPVVVEGVETQEQVEFLRSIGCEIFQGYHYSKPISVKDFEKKYNYD